MATVLGAAIGVAIGGAIAGIAASSIRCESGGMECLGIALLVAALVGLGVLVGAPLSCYLFLRWRGHPRAGRTVVYMLVLIIPVSIALGLTTEIGGEAPEPLRSLGAVVLVVAAVLTPPLLGRWLALRG